MHASHNISWPHGLKGTAIRTRWFQKISRLTPDLDLEGAARLLREPYAAVRRWGVLFGYKFPDRRRAVLPEQWRKVDWRKRDAQIARELNVTRECVRLVRRARGAGPSAAQAATRDFEHFVIAQRDGLHGLLVQEVIGNSKTKLPYHVARRILREQGVRPHLPASPLRGIDWRLPNRDLATIWHTSSRYIANLRARLEVGEAAWNARQRDIQRDRKYRAALQRERSNAQAQRTSGGHNGTASKTPARANSRHAYEDSPVTPL